MGLVNPLISTTRVCPKHNCPLHSKDSGRRWYCLICHWRGR